MTGFEVYDLNSGALGVKIRYFADEEKDAAWLEAVKRSMAATPDNYTLEILMEDRTPPPTALFKQSDIDANRRSRMEVSPYIIVVGLDPAVTKKHTSDATGIVVAAAGKDHRVYVLCDASGKYTPEECAKTVAFLCSHYKTPHVFYEQNQGGDYIPSMIKTVAQGLNIKGVHSSKGKEVRAEMPSIWYTQGVVSHVGDKGEDGRYPLEDLEREITLWDPLDKTLPSPNRLDALVVALKALEPYIAYDLPDPVERLEVVR